MRKPQTRGAQKSREDCRENSPVTLRAIAAHLNLSPATVSLILNNAPNFAFPDETRKRVIATAQSLGYIPNRLARSLRNRAELRMVGLILPDISRSCYAEIASGIGNKLAQSDYCFMLADHGYRRDAISQQIGEFSSRGAQGVILIDAELGGYPQLPFVTVSCRAPAGRTAQIVFDRDRAVVLAMEHFLLQRRQQILLMKEGCDEPYLSKVLEIASSLHLEVAVAAVKGIKQEQSVLDSFGSDWRVGKGIATHRRGVLTFDLDSAATVVRAFGGRNGDPARLLATVCIEREGRAGTDSSITVIRQPLKTTGIVAAEVLLQKIRQKHCPMRTIRVKPEIVRMCATSAKWRSRDAIQPVNTGADCKMIGDLKTQ